MGNGSASYPTETSRLPYPAGTQCQSGSVNRRRYPHPNHDGGYSLYCRRRHKTVLSGITVVLGNPIELRPAMLQMCHKALDYPSLWRENHHPASGRGYSGPCLCQDAATPPAVAPSLVKAVTPSGSSVCRSLAITSPLDFGTSASVIIN